MWSFFKKKKKEEEEEWDFAVPDYSFLHTDMHSHMVPGIDDGAATIEDSVSLLRGLYDVGFRKIITTPHVHGDFYRNAKEQLLEGQEVLRQRLAQEEMAIELQVSAEYYLDHYFLEQVLPHGLLPFGKNEVLVEVSLMGWPRELDHIIFSTQSEGYNLILAHPERYLYEQDIAVFQSWKDKGVLLQLNLLSLFGYYGLAVKELADKLLNAGLYDYVGTDMHHQRHLKQLESYLERQSRPLKRLSRYAHFRNIQL